MSSMPPKNGHIDLLSEMIEIVRQELGVNQCDADQIGASIMRGMRRYYGGHEIYIPAQDKSERDAAIKRDFNGRNVKEVAHAHNVCRKTVYNIAKK